MASAKEIIERDHYVKGIGGFFEVVGGLTGGLSILGHNIFSGRPSYARLPVMLLTAGAGALAGGAINKYRHFRTHQQAMIIEDYVRLHPELFPENTEKPYSQLFLPWRPVR